MIKTLFKYFFQGLLFIAPIGVTLYMIVAFIAWIDKLIPINIPGIGFLIIVSCITLLGFLGSHFIAQPFIDTIDNIINRIPLVGLIYSSIKDLTNAFVGKKKKFNRPVLVNLTRDSTLQRLGFITQSDLSSLGILDKVAVYLPHSYNISGNLFIIPAEQVQPLDANGAELMKFIISGGVSEI